MSFISTASCAASPTNSPPRGESVLSVACQAGDSIGDVLTRLGVPHEETSNIFVNGELCALSKEIQDGQRVGVFPDDMALLYKWYFPKQK